MDSRLKATRAEIDSDQAQIKDLHRKIADAQARLNLTPLREQQLAELTRDYENSKQNYQSLLQKKLQSELATNLEKNQEGEQFRVIDPPSLPQKPSQPNRRQVLLIGWLLGLFVGAGLVVVREMSDEVLRNEKDFRQHIRLPILTRIPILISARERTSSLRNRGFEVAGLALLILVSRSTQFLHVQGGMKVYQSFFKLDRSPFEISPDPGFLYATGQHQEAVAGLRYGVLSRKGFMVLTGEVGTGKSLVVRCLLDSLDKERVAYAYVFNSLLTSQELLFYVAEDLGIGVSSASKADVLLRLGRYFIDRHQKGLTTMLIIEEAQHLSELALEEIRMLTNLETPQGKSLQVILVGQPELEATLQTKALRQLKQRIALWFRLHPLPEAEAFAYVDCRLKLAGNENGASFRPRGARTRLLLFAGNSPADQHAL